MHRRLIFVQTSVTHAHITLTHFFLATITRGIINLITGVSQTKQPAPMAQTANDSMIAPKMCSPPASPKLEVIGREQKAVPLDFPSDDEATTVEVATVKEKSRSKTREDGSRERLNALKRRSASNGKRSVPHAFADSRPRMAMPEMSEM